MLMKPFRTVFHKTASGSAVVSVTGHQLLRLMAVHFYATTDLRLVFSGLQGLDDGFAVAVACTSTDLAALKAYTLMANAYVDLGTYAYFTPYIGGGIGGSYVKWDKLRNTSCETGDPSNCDPTVEHGGKGSWRFAYQLMAGASIDVTCKVKPDLGYASATHGWRQCSLRLGTAVRLRQGLYSHSRTWRRPICFRRLRTQSPTSRRRELPATSNDRRPITIRKAPILAFRASGVRESVLRRSTESITEIRISRKA